MLRSHPGEVIHISNVVYAVAAGTYAFYSFNMIMYGVILSLGVAATVYTTASTQTDIEKGSQNLREREPLPCGWLSVQR